MIVLGNICLGLALLIYLIPLQLMLHDTPRKNGDGGVLWGAIFTLSPLWLLLTVALCAVTAKGGFDWLLRARVAQFPVVLAAGMALFVVTGFSMLGKFEHPSQMPWASRFFTGWAVQLFPPVTMGFCLLALNPKLGSSVPAMAYRVPFAAVAMLSALATVAMLLQWLSHSQQVQQARVKEAIEFENNRDRDVMAWVETLKSVDDFAELLGFANRFETPAIRELAIRKTQTHPDFLAALRKVLQSGSAEKGLVYLDACDVPEPKALAKPVRQAILNLAEEARDSMKRTHTLHAGQFDWNTRLILSVAEKFRGSGVDYAPAIREFRAALDEPRTQKIQLNAVHPLDTWLAKQSKDR